MEDGESSEGLGLRRALGVANQVAQERCGEITRPFVVRFDAGEGGCAAQADFLVIVDAHHGNIVRDGQPSAFCALYDEFADVVVRGENRSGLGDFIEPYSEFLHEYFVARFSAPVAECQAGDVIDSEGCRVFPSALDTPSKIHVEGDIGIRLGVESQQFPRGVLREIGCVRENADGAATDGFRTAVEKDGRHAKIVFAEVIWRASVVDNHPDRRPEILHLGQSFRQVFLRIVFVVIRRGQAELDDANIPSERLCRPQDAVELRDI